MPPPRLRWDVFCRVIDNFGDVGVCWRLARELAGEHALAVTLWLDQPRALAGIAPGYEPWRASQRLAGVTVRHWPAEDDSFVLPAEGVADAVVEGFGCGLPSPYVAAMSGAPEPPRWFVLEYLSAEPWVDGVHGRASPHPSLGLPRRFWFPGFTPATGGLLREQHLLAARDRFVGNRAAIGGLWARLEVPAPDPRALCVSLFCYPHPQLPALLDAWDRGDRPIVCLVPEGVAVEAVAAWERGPAPGAGGALRLQRIPFVGQDDYDRLLWACDINFVRGEDSFVRAQWAARPLVWHLYPQTEAAHLAKLDAFAARFCVGMPEASAAAWRGFLGAWNSAPGAPPIAQAWAPLAAALPDLNRHASDWAGALARLPELGAGLVRAARDKV